MSYAKADVLVNTGKGGTSGSEDGDLLAGRTSDGFFDYLAGQITIGNGATINAVKAWMSSPFTIRNTSSAGDINIVLRADSNGIPGTALFTQKFTLSVVADPRWETFPGLNWKVGSGTYWIALEPVDGNPGGYMFEGAPHPLDAYAYNVDGNDGWVTFAYINSDETPDDRGSLGFKIIGKANEAAGDIDLAVTPLYQDGAAWANDQYDNEVGETMRAKGCALTALTMAINYIGADIDGEKTPGDLNKLHDVSANGDVDWVRVTKDASGNQLEYRSKSIDSNADHPGGDPSGAEQYITNVLDNLSLPVIVGVNLVPNTRRPGFIPTHYVLVTGHSGNQFQIIDPGHKANTTLDNYKNLYMTRGYVRVISDPRTTKSASDSPLAETTGTDNSGLYVAVTDNVLLQVVDPSGKVSGTDFSSGDSMEGIAQSSDFTDALDDDLTGEPATGSTHFVYIDQPASGTYQIKIQGVTSGSYTLSSSSVSSDGTVQSPMIIAGTTSTGKIDTYAAPVTSSTVTVLAAGDGTAVEGGKKGKVLVQRTGDLSAPLAVLYKVKGAAAAGIDYEPVTGTVTIPAGAAKAKVKIKPVTGSPNHGTFKMKLVVKPATDGSYNVGTPKKAIIELIEGD